MKVGLVGDATRTVAWEKHLRPHAIVSEVDLVSNVEQLGKVDACFILNDTPNNLEVVLNAVQHGYHTFLIAKQPTQGEMLERIHRASKEAGVKVQFSHWPTLAPATQWMMNSMHRPSLLISTKHINRNTMIDALSEFRNAWVDELGLALKWINSGIHHIEAKQQYLDDTNPVAIILSLRFDNGSSANISIYAASDENQHQRIVCSKTEVLDCNVSKQQIRIGRLNDGSHLFFGKQEFDPSKAAEKAALLFLKAVQLNTETAYSSYDALQLSQLVEKVEQRLKMF